VLFLKRIPEFPKKSGNPFDRHQYFFAMTLIKNAGIGVFGFLMSLQPRVLLQHIGNSMPGVIRNVHHYSRVSQVHFSCRLPGMITSASPVPVFPGTGGIRLFGITHPGHDSDALAGRSRVQPLEKTEDDGAPVPGHPGPVPKLPGRSVPSKYTG